MAVRKSKFRRWLEKQPRGTRAKLVRTVSEGAVARAFRGEPLGWSLAVSLSCAAFFLSRDAPTEHDLLGAPRKPRKRVVK